MKSVRLSWCAAALSLAVLLLASNGCTMIALAAYAVHEGLKAEPPVQKAARKGRLGEVKRLLTADNHEDAMFGASLGNRKRVMRYVIEQGGDKDIALRIVAEGRESMIWPARYERRGMAKLLIDLGAEPCGGHGSQETGSRMHQTPAHNAARFGNVRTLRLFLDHGCPVDLTGPRNTTLLREALASHIYNSRIKHRQTVRLLLNRGADPNVIGAGGLAPIHSVTKGDTKVLRWLIEAGGDVNIRSGSGETLLHTAIWAHPNMRLIRMLLRAGADPNARTNSGRTPLHRVVEEAALNLHPGTQRSLNRVARVLIEAGADVNARDRHGVTPLDVYRVYVRSDEERGRGGGPYSAEVRLSELASLLRSHGAE